jgi:negative regulator of flagellin synthesis FlgM
MIDGVAKAGPGRIGPSHGTVEGSAPSAATGNAAQRGRSGNVQNSVLDLVAGGPPVDDAKVAAIRSAIAEGRYPVDADKIAERMIALDLPARA